MAAERSFDTSVIQLGPTSIDPSATSSWITRRAIRWVALGRSFICTAPHQTSFGWNESSGYAKALRRGMHAKTQLVPDLVRCGRARGL